MRMIEFLSLVAHIVVSPFRTRARLEAEIILLKAQQAGGYSAPQALAALEQARMDLDGGTAKAGVKDLQTAEAALRTPTK